MIEILVICTLLIISILLLLINCQILLVTIEMLEVTKDIYKKTGHLFTYTKKTYEVLGGEEGLTNFHTGDKVIQMENSSALVHEDIKDK